MLSRAFRLRTNTDFDRTYKYGRSANSLNFYIKFNQTHYKNSRVAVVVSKKISKRAVVRNRCKRRLVELVRVHWDQLVPGFNIIVQVKVDISKISSQLLEKELLACLAKAQLTSTKVKSAEVNHA